MNSIPPCEPKDGCSPPTVGADQTELFSEPKPPPIVLRLIGIPLPVDKKRKTPQLVPNCHIPSMKNNKMLVTKGPNGKPLRTPLLITKPAYQQWKEKAIASLESTLISECLITGEGIQQALLRLSAILSRLPADDSVNDLPNGSWSVQLVPPGQEGAVITIEKLHKRL